METNQKMNKVRSIINERILECLQKGIEPWKISWSERGLPRNLISGEPYHAINHLLLNSREYDRNYFLTHKQALSLGGKIKKGEKGHLVTFWKEYEKKNPETGNTETIPVLRYYRVFNIDQCEGITEERIPRIEKISNDGFRRCEDVIKHMPDKPKKRYTNSTMHYDAAKDEIVMRRHLKDYKAQHYAELFYLLIKSTGHPQRLNYPELSQSNAPHDLQTLSAEIGASYLQSLTGIASPNNAIDNHSPQYWHKILEDDPSLIFHACTMAQKATDYVLNIRKEKEVPRETRIINSAAATEENRRLEELLKTRENHSQAIDLEK